MAAGRVKTLQCTLVPQANAITLHWHCMDAAQKLDVPVWRISQMGASGTSSPASLVILGCTVSPALGWLWCAQHSIDP
jgi:hypothetical protein